MPRKCTWHPLPFCEERSSWNVTLWRTTIPGAEEYTQNGNSQQHVAYGPTDANTAQLQERFRWHVEAQCAALLGELVLIR